jgi:hypothetical protein
VAALLAAARAWNARAEKESPDPALAAEALAAARRSGDPVLISGALAAAVAAAAEAGQLRLSYRLIQERAVLVDRLSRHDPCTGAEIVDTIHTAADSAAIAGELPAALASARRGQGDSIVVGRHYMTLGMAIVPLVLQGKFDEALSEAAVMWDSWQREGRPASSWLAPAGYAAVLAHGLRGDEEAAVSGVPGSARSPHAVTRRRTAAWPASRPSPMPASPSTGATSNRPPVPPLASGSGRVPGSAPATCNTTRSPSPSRLRPR